ncbi:nitrilase-related carbon-nitrogen hydrolase [Bordetella sp. N]|uniref:nitrilase-related carbon-nitrogen hydrolase n=1 Tax=Bordetella sp. N TaxID=1746199 RepID=UPI00070C7A3D|nr:nitrilase-related carbon-nitrogen hydrolase [Bordetella sp. N]ALM83492.1 hypothetical protein ASB57_11380 [Bordetella sp. N]
MNAGIRPVGTTVTVGQVAGTEDVSHNLKEIEAVVEAASRAGSSLVVFPEAVMYLFTEPADVIAQAAMAHGAQVEATLQSYADRHRIAIVAGLYLPSSTKGRSRNVLALFQPGSGKSTQYDKLHHYDAFDFKESEKHDRVPLQPNYEELVVFECDGIKFGLLNCYDLRFPEMSRLLVEKGADALIVASGWVAGPLKALQWETLARARAIENTCYVVACCQPAPNSVGLSMIVDPMGAVIAGVHESAGYASGRMDMARQAYVRSILPCVSQRRYMLMQRDAASEGVQHGVR